MSLSNASEILRNHYLSIPGEVVVLYHANCVDGFYAHVLLRRMFNDSTTDDMAHAKDYQLVPYQTDIGNWYIPVAYEDTKTFPTTLYEIVRGKHAIVVDFSFEIPALRVLSGLAKSVLIIDHHKTLLERVVKHNDEPPHGEAIRMMNLPAVNNINPLQCLLPAPEYKYFGIPDEEQDMFPPFANTLVIYDSKYCGSMLTAIVFGDPSVEKLNFDCGGPLFFIQDYDLYSLTHSSTKAVNAILHIQMYTVNVEHWKKVDSFLWYDDRYLSYGDMCVDMGQVLLAKEEKQLQQYLPTARKGLIGEQEFVFVNAPSEFANSIGEKLSNVTGLPVAIWITRKEYTKVSLRSSKTKGNVDVSAIAGQYGGGGHHNAASFSFPIGDELGRLFI